MLNVPPQMWHETCHKSVMNVLCKPLKKSATDAIISNVSQLQFIRAFMMFLQRSRARSLIFSARSLTSVSMFSFSNLHSLHRSRSQRWERCCCHSDGAGKHLSLEAGEKRMNAEGCLAEPGDVSCLKALRRSLFPHISHTLLFFLFFFKMKIAAVQE